MFAPLIGITTSLTVDKTPERAYVNITYIRAVHEAGGIPLLLPPHLTVEVQAALWERLDGLVLTGGGDIDPARFEQPRHPKTDDIAPARDELELGLTRRALDEEMPLFAICRGLQVLNVALGGTLVQDLVAPDGTHPHRKFKGTFDGNAHTVELAPGSLAERAVGEHAHIAHCHHHQAVLALGDGLVVSGRAEDGLIEAIEMADGRWGLGVQWHPEANDRSRLFGAVCDAAAQRMAKPVRPSGGSSRTSTLATSA